ncbi:hypothetical protein H6P81_010688 [Aristolochia fimbriata]|uniref:Uncharacterized protein n=1 Tax=Aristolochia fimbriata TaxID=158543 RepID=A0AAV7ETX0_ARIFI|nr:hypothetical protein H6P81_010688 [Aristolochia fimbriata]
MGSAAALLAGLIVVVLLLPSTPSAADADVTAPPPGPSTSSASTKLGLSASSTPDLVSAPNNEPMYYIASPIGDTWKVVDTPTLSPVRAVDDSANGASVAAAMSGTAAIASVLFAALALL